MASARAIDLLLEVAGGKADEGIVVGGSMPNLTGVVEMRPERCNMLLGMEIPDSAKLLSRLGLKHAGGNRWEIPSFRQDLIREVEYELKKCAGWPASKEFRRVLTVRQPEVRLPIVFTTNSCNSANGSWVLGFSKREP